MLRNLPNPEVVSAHSDPTAMSKARAASQLANSFLRNGVIKFETLYNACLASQIHGGSWFKVSWNPFTGPHSKEARVKEDPKAPGILKPELDVFGDPIYDQVFLGEIQVEHCNIAECLLDPTATEEDLRYVVQLKTYLVSKLTRCFPRRLFWQEIQWQTNYRANSGARRGCRS